MMFLTIQTIYIFCENMILATCEHHNLKPYTFQSAFRIVYCCLVVLANEKASSKISQAILPTEQRISNDLTNGNVPEMVQGRGGGKTSPSTTGAPPDFALPQQLTEQKYCTNKANLKQTFEREAKLMGKKKSTPTPKLSTCLEPHEPPGENMPSPVPENPVGRPVFERQESNLSDASSLDARNSAVLDRRRTIGAFMDAISESGRKLSSIVHENQTQALETLLADLQGRALSPQRVVLYSLLTFLLLVTCYWLTAWLLQHLLALRDTLTGQLDKLSASQSSQLEQLSARLGNMEALMSGLSGQGDTGRQLEQVIVELILVVIELSQVMVQLKEGMEGNALKVTVMDRLVAELAGIETALVSLQDQVILVFLHHLYHPGHFHCLKLSQEIKNS